ncbi:glycosyltransferase family 1 protein [Bacteroides sp. OttesenSCG-928-D19]|nr:glycosyltransferase family 1 protein [Bacteroides sp. OttesenSCG-928-D19]
MKVLIVFREGDSDNLFVYTLFNGIAQQGIDIQCSTEKFWKDDSFYDIIHFQWPEEVVGWNCSSMTIVDDLKKRIQYLKSRGSKIVYTRHNVCPHYSNKSIGEAYRIIESESDVIVHMAEYSYHNFLEKYPDSHNIVIPHHIYENIYKEDLTVEEARQKLHIGKNRFVITAFGKFRNREESNMVIKSFLKAKIRNKYLLAPRIFPFHYYKENPNKTKKIITWLATKVGIPAFRLLNVHGGSAEEIVTNEDLPYYISSANIIFIQRINILNSGNVPLAFLFKKVVIGPDVGDVGEILRLTGNPTFDPANKKSIVDAIREGYSLSKSGHGMNNYNYAIEHYNVERISREYIKCYSDLINRNE